MKQEGPHTTQTYTNMHSKSDNKHQQRLPMKDPTKNEDDEN